MFSEHHEIAQEIKHVLAERLDDERKACSLEVHVLDLKTFEILLMDRRAVIGVDEAKSIATEDESVIEPLLAELCRQVHTVLYDRRKLLIQERQLLYEILVEAGLESEFRREFVSSVYDQHFKEAEKSDNRSKLVEVAMEVEWLKSRIAQALEASGSPGLDPVDESEPRVTVEISESKEITVEIPEAGEPAGETEESLVDTAEKEPAA